MHYGALEVRPHIFSGDPDCLYALLAHQFVAATVALGRSFKVVRHPIDFNRHSGRLAVKVEDERTKWVLPSKPKSSGT